MSFFNPFRKNAQNRDARQEPGTREERPAVDGSGRLEPSFENTNVAKTMKASGQPTDESRTDGVPPPWGEAPKAMPGETPKTPATVRLNENGIPPAFEEVKPARATFDPYGIAAQAQAEARAARESEREAAEEKVENLVDRPPQASEQGVSEGVGSPLANAEGFPKKTADLSSGLGQESGFASSRAASAQTQPQDNLQAAGESSTSSKEVTPEGVAAVAGAAGDAMASSVFKPRKAREKVSAAAELEADEEPATVISEPKAAPKKVHNLQMVRELSEEEIIARRRTKHRLVGAAALLLAVVVAAPFVLDNESSFETASIDTTIPSVSDNSTTLEVPPVPVDDALESKLEALEGAGAATEETGTEANAQADSKVPAKAEVKSAEKGADNTSAKPSSDKTQKAAQADQKADKTDKTEKTAQKPQTAPSVGITPPEGKGFYVQVMATSSELEAERTVKKLALLGLPAYRMPVERKATTLWRVRVGLYKTRKEAEGVVGTIVLNGIVSKPLVGAQ